MKKKYFSALILICVTAIFFSACAGCNNTNNGGGGNVGGDSTIRVTQVLVNGTTLSLEVGRSEKVDCLVLPADATNKNVTWSSSNEEVVSVTNEGNVTAVAVGVATVTVTTEDGGHTAECVVTVYAPYEAGISVTEVRLNCDFLELNVGQTAALIATVQPVNAENRDVTWSSSDAKVAAVADGGTVTAISSGRAIVTVTTADGEKTAECELTINPSSAVVPVTGITLSKSYSSLTVGQTEEFLTTIYPSDATDKSVTWSSNNATIAAVTDGRVTALSPGNAFITATTADGNMAVTCTVTVTARRFTVTFVDGGDVLQTQEVNEGSVAVQPKDMAREGYEFKGWAQGSPDGGIFDYAIPVEDNITLYAVWEAKTEDYGGIKQTGETVILFSNGPKMLLDSGELSEKLSGVTITLSQTTRTKDSKYFYGGRAYSDSCRLDGNGEVIIRLAQTRQVTFCYYEYNGRENPRINIGGQIYGGGEGFEDGYGRYYSVTVTLEGGVDYTVRNGGVEIELCYLIIGAKQ